MKILIAMLLVLPLAACQTQGPFERAGRNVDETIEIVTEGSQDVIQDVREGAADVRDDITRRRR
jgi:hypothetical protein